MLHAAGTALNMATSRSDAGFRAAATDGVKAVPVGDMLPALVVAPLLTLLVQAVRG